MGSHGLVLDVQGKFPFRGFCVFVLNPTFSDKA